MPDHTRAEVEGDDEGQRLICAAREEALLVRHESEADVCGQPEGSDRDPIPEDGGEAMADVALVRPAVDEPGGRRAEDVAPEDLEDCQEWGRDAVQRGVSTEEPGGEACETEEQQDPDQPGVVRRGLTWRDRGRRRDGAAAEVEGDDDYNGVHQNNGDRISLKE